MKDVEGGFQGTSKEDNFHRTRASANNQEEVRKVLTKAGVQERQLQFEHVLP